MNSKYMLAAGVLTIFILFIHSPIARAVGGSSKGGGLIGLILLPFFIIYSAFIPYFAAKKIKQAKALIKRISVLDSAWELDHLKAELKNLISKYSMPGEIEIKILPKGI